MKLHAVEAKEMTRMRKGIVTFHVECQTRGRHALHNATATQVWRTMADTTPAEVERRKSATYSSRKQKEKMPSMVWPPKANRRRTVGRRTVKTAQSWLGGGGGLGGGAVCAVVGASWWAILFFRSILETGCSGKSRE